MKVFLAVLGVILVALVETGFWPAAFGSSPPLLAFLAVFFGLAVLDGGRRLWFAVLTGLIFDLSFFSATFFHVIFFLLLSLLLTGVDMLLRFEAPADALVRFLLALLCWPFLFWTGASFVSTAAVLPFRYTNFLLGRDAAAEFIAFVLAAFVLIKHFERNRLAVLSRLP